MKQKRVIFFDGVCNLCNGTVDFLFRHSKEGELHFASLQSDVAKEYLGDSAEELLSVIYFRDGKIHQESSAVIWVMADTFLLFKWLPILLIIPSFIRNFFYQVVAKNRYKWFGQREACRVPTEQEKTRFLG